MNHIVTTGIVLGRTDFGEADRILTVLTPDQGKLRLMAKGVRRVKSKLAGGIELFSVSQITFIRGKGDIGTLVSTRLNQHYGNIVSHIERVQLGYELIKLLDKATEDEPEQGYFDLLQRAFEALNDSAIDADLVRTWFSAQLLGLAGHMPNMSTDINGKPLAAEKTYAFDLDSMTFQELPDGNYGSNEIKFIRLLFSGTAPRVLAAVQGANQFVGQMQPLLRAMAADYLRAET